MTSIISALRRRGCVPNPPANNAVIEEFCRRFELDSKNEVVLLYKSFDGFEEYDPASWMNVWPLYDVLNSGDKMVVEGKTYIAFGDTAANAAVYYFMPNDSMAPIFADDRELVAISFSSFWDKLIGGGFDLK